MTTDPVLSALVVNHSKKVVLGRSATKEVVVRYNFKNGDVLGHGKVSVQAEKRAFNRRGRSTNLKMAVVDVCFESDRERADINAICRDYDEYCRLTGNPERAISVDLDTLFDRDLLWYQTEDFFGVPEKSLSATRALRKVVGCAVLISKKLYIYLVKELIVKVKDTGQNLGGKWQKIDKDDEKIKLLILQV